MTFFLGTYSIYTNGFQIPHLKKKKKKKTGSRSGSSGLTHRVARVWPGCCHSRSFIKPGPVQPLGRSGPGSTRRAGPGLITVLHRNRKYNVRYRFFYLLCTYHKLKFKVHIWKKCYLVNILAIGSICFPGVEEFNF
jgi:hypothetical protein